jgi:hypothetical protein
MLTSSNSLKIHYILRVAAAMCFIGHGAFGIIGKPVWCNYFAVLGIDSRTALQLMPVLGSVDVMLGLIFLFRPVRAIAVWLVLWGIVTALLRPLSGEPFAEFIERAGNFGVSLCLLILAGRFNLSLSGFFSTINPNEPVDEKTMSQVKTWLGYTVFLLLAGHGWLNLLHKPGLISQYSSLGFQNPVNISIITGIFEIMAAIALLVSPARPLIMLLLIWKMGTELFYPHFEIFEWVERGGSYGALLAFWLCLEPMRQRGIVQRGLTVDG